MRHASLVALAAALTGGCYHFSLEQHPARTTTTSAASGAPAEVVRTVTYEEQVPTYLNGLVGAGTIDVWRYCAEPIRTELRVTLEDAMLSTSTFLVYTPQTLYVTCEIQAPRLAAPEP